MTERQSDISLDFYQQCPLVVQCSELDLSSDVGLLLARQAEDQVHICQDLNVWLRYAR